VKVPLEDSLGERDGEELPQALGVRVPEAHCEAL
jgi:hypothetical protein